MCLAQPPSFVSVVYMKEFYEHFSKVWEGEHRRKALISPFRVGLRVSGHGVMDGF